MYDNGADESRFCFSIVVFDLRARRSSVKKIGASRMNRITITNRMNRIHLCKRIKNYYRFENLPCLSVFQLRSQSSFQEPQCDHTLVKAVIYLYYTLTIHLLYNQPCFPTMNTRELVDHIRSGPALLALDEPLLYHFNECLQALQSSETIRHVRCKSHQQLCITEHEWVLLVKTIGIIKDLHYLELYCRAGSQYFRPFQAIAEAVKSAHSLCGLRIGLCSVTAPGDPSELAALAALANYVRDHAALKEFGWFDFGSGLEAVQGVTPDVVLRILPACPHLRAVTIMSACASTGAIKNLLQ
jgi:hypothetical protein